MVDSYLSGDGQGGHRTAATGIPHLYEEQTLGNWRSEELARALYDWLHARIGGRVGWSQAGFAALVTQRKIAMGQI